MSNPDEWKAYNVRLRGKSRATFERVIARVRAENEDLKMSGILALVCDYAEAEMDRQRKHKDRAGAKTP